MNNKNFIEKPECVIILDDDFSKVDFDCPVCDLALRHYDDVISVKWVGCCEDCQISFYWPNKKEWENGWRPKKEDLRNVLNNYKCLNGDSQDDK